MRRDDGAAAVEFAILGTMLLLLVSGLLPTLQAVLAYNDLSRATAEGLRYAAHAAPNPRPGADDCPALTRWPSQDQVRTYVQDSAGRDDAVVRVLDADGQEVSPCLVSFAAQRRIVVQASIEQDLGLLAGLANGMAGLFGSAEPFPNDSITLTATSAGLKE